MIPEDGSKPVGATFSRFLRPRGVAFIIIVLAAFRLLVTSSGRAFYYSDSWDYIIPALQPIGAGFVDSFHSPYVGWVWQVLGAKRDLGIVPILQSTVGLIVTGLVVAGASQTNARVGVAARRVALVGIFVFVVCSSPAVIFYERAYLSDSLAASAFGLAMVIAIAGLLASSGRRQWVTFLALPVLTFALCLRTSLLWPSFVAIFFLLVVFGIRMRRLPGNLKLSLLFVVATSLFSCWLIVSPLISAHDRVFGIRSLAPASGTGMYMRWSYLDGCDGLQRRATNAQERRFASELCEDETLLTSYDANVWAYPAGSRTMEPSPDFINIQKFLRRNAVDSIRHNWGTVAVEILKSTWTLGFSPVSDLPAYSSTPPQLPVELGGDQNHFPRRRSGAPGESLAEFVSWSFRLIGWFVLATFAIVAAALGRRLWLTRHWTALCTATLFVLVVGFSALFSVGAAAKPMSRYLLPILWVVPYGLALTAALVAPSPASLSKEGES